MKTRTTTSKSKILLATGAAVSTLAVALAFPASASAQTSDWGGHGHYGYSGYSHWGESDEHSQGTIVDTLVERGNFTTLVAAVQAAGLADTLSAPGELTVFAPTDRAFAKLPAGTVESLLANKDALTKVLTNHVVAGYVDGETAVEVGEAQSLAGNTLNIGYGNDSELYVNDARIKVTDIETSNGVIHVIDAVLVP